MKSLSQKHRMFSSILIGILAFALSTGCLGNTKEDGLLDQTIPSPHPTASPGSKAIEPTNNSPTPTINPAIGITFEEDQQIGPFAPTTPSLTISSDGSVSIEWRNTGSDITSYFNVYRKDHSSDWKIVGHVEANPEQDYFLFVDKPNQGSESIMYVITAVDVYGNESQFSDSGILSTNNNE